MHAFTLERLHNRFISRLYASPMRASDYILGYTLPIFPIAIAQAMLTLGVAFCFGLPVTLNVLLALLVMVPIIVLFVGIGITLGSFMSGNSATGVCSVVVQMAALLSGMWFDLDAIGGGLSVFCHILPFAHAYDAFRYALSGNFSALWLPVLVCVCYAAVFYTAAVLVFKKKMKG